MVRFAKMPEWHAALAEPTRRIYEFCLGRIYQVEEIDSHGLLVLNVSADIDSRFGGFRNDIRLEAEYLEEVVLPDHITYSTVTAADFEELAALRIAAMRESLEHLGRFDPERARERLWNSFYPEHTEFIVLDGERVGFHTLRPVDDGLYLNHLYIHPRWQRGGIGSHVLKHLLARADALQEAVYLCALRDSAANPFYQRHGFVQTSQDDPDIYYRRAPVR